MLGSTGMIEGFAVHPLSDDVIVTGPDTATWSLAARAPVWTSHGDANSPAAGFWNAEDALLSGSGLTQLPAGGGSDRVLWQPPEDIRSSPRVDAGGDFAAAGKEHPNNSLIVVLQKSADTVTALHTVRTTTGLNLIRMSPAGERFAASDAYNAMDVFDTMTGQRLVRCEPTGIAQILDVRWLGAGRLLGTGTHGVRGSPGSDERLVLWDATTGRPIRDLRGGPVINALAITPDQLRFTAAGPDKVVRIRDAQTLELLSDFRAHDGPVTALAFHPSQPILATGSADMTIRLWNLNDGRLLEELRPSSKEPQSLRFSPSGKRLSCIDAGGTVFVWDFSQT